jgi:hypothetical protein
VPVMFMFIYNMIFRSNFDVDLVGCLVCSYLPLYLSISTMSPGQVWSKHASWANPQSVHAVTGW